MAGKGIPELLNYKQKGKDLNEFIKVPLSEKLAYCFGDPALTLMYTMTTTLLIYFYTNVVGISAGAEYTLYEDDGVHKDYDREENYRVLKK